MEYFIDIAGLYERTYELVSREAGIAYDDAGDSLYDGIIIGAADRPAVVRAIADAVSALVERTRDICTVRDGYIREDEMGVLIEHPAALSFSVPDFDTDNEALVAGEVSGYISLSAAASWFAGHHPSKAEEYALRSQRAMDRAVTLLKTIKTPQRQWK